ncbi:hypothetical protein JR316_0005425 [Psilocybe cubensis]|uniref:Uncharacterized protein n=1 Tax=Psilocybe cubensis TaxID=181762 RepID=A0ACB8H811_PSICU|nr:hypothetical protein JR316_0005425 [Psilocybe cubensis]KAH9483319.1 hypothetical protein JR316_0005425 [Psilocybe cubensis]
MADEPGLMLQLWLRWRRVNGGQIGELFLFEYAQASILRHPFTEEEDGNEDESLRRPYANLTRESERSSSKAAVNKLQLK